MRLSAQAIWRAIDQGRIVFRAFEPERKMNNEKGPWNTDSFDCTIGGEVMILKPPTGLKGFIVRKLRSWGICVMVAGPVWRPRVETWQQYIDKHYMHAAFLSEENPTWEMPAYSFAIVRSRENFCLRTGESRVPAWEGEPCLVADVFGKTGPARLGFQTEKAKGLHAHDGIVTMELTTEHTPVELFYGMLFCQVYIEEARGDTAVHGSCVKGQTGPNGKAKAA